MPGQPSIEFIRRFHLEGACTRALSLAVHDAIVDSGGLDTLSRRLLTLRPHPVFAESTTCLVNDLQNQAENREVHTRDSGTVMQAIAAMCIRAEVCLEELPAILSGGGAIAPIVFHSAHMDRHMVAGDLTVYRV